MNSSPPLGPDMPAHGGETALERFLRDAPAVSLYELLGLDERDRRRQAAEEQSRCRAAWESIHEESLCALLAVAAADALRETAQEAAERKRLEVAYKGQVAAAVSAAYEALALACIVETAASALGDARAEAAPADRQRQAERQQREAEWAALVDAADDQLQFVGEWMRDTVQRVKGQMEPGDSVTDSAADAPAGQQAREGSSRPASSLSDRKQAIQEKRQVMLALRASKALSTAQPPQAGIAERTLSEHVADDIAGAHEQPLRIRKDTKIVQSQPAQSNGCPDEMMARMGGHAAMEIKLHELEWLMHVHERQLAEHTDYHCSSALQVSWEQGMLEAQDLGRRAKAYREMQRQRAVSAATSTICHREAAGQRPTTGSRLSCDSSRVSAGTWTPPWRKISTMRVDSDTAERLRWAWEDSFPSDVTLRDGNGQGIHQAICHTALRFQPHTQTPMAPSAPPEDAAVETGFGRDVRQGGSSKATSEINPFHCTLQYKPRQQTPMPLAEPALPAPSETGEDPDMTISEQSYEVEYGTPRSSLSMYDTPFYVTRPPVKSGPNTSSTATDLPADSGMNCLVDTPCGSTSTLSLASAY